MNRKFFIAGIILLLATVFLCCQKRLFKTITVGGRILHSSTQQPFSNADIALYGDDVTSAKNSTENTIELATGTTNSDGTFSLRTLASRSGMYCLHVKGRTVYINGQRRLDVKEGTKNDLGDIFVDW